MVQFLESEKTADPFCEEYVKTLSDSVKNSRRELSIVDQVLERIATAEFVQQPRQVANNGRWIWGVDVARYVPDLHQGEVPIGVGPMCCGYLQQGYIMDEPWLRHPVTHSPINLKSRHSADRLPIRAITLMYRRHANPSPQSANYTQPNLPKPSLEPPHHSSLWKGAPS